MKIISVDVFMLKHTGTAYSAFPLRPCVCRVNTDEGIYGYGEAGISIGFGEKGVAQFLADIASLIIGMDPMQNEAIWEMIRCRCSGHLSGGGVVVFSAMGALDTALMDIKGKALGVPCYQLLGGKHRETLRCYVSQAQTGWRRNFKPIGTSEGYADVSKRIQDEGFDAVKINFIAYNREANPIPRSVTTGPLSKDLLRMIEERLSAIRSVCGTDMGIIMENICATDVTAAVQIAHLAEQYDVLFLEEPVFNFNPELLGVIARKTRVPLSSGEKVHTRWGFYQMLKENAVSIIQPDLCNTGGLAEAKKICDMAHIFDVKMQAHVAGTPISEAAAMQLEAAVPNFFIHEYYSMANCPECLEYCTSIYEPVNGYITVPELPGIGQELSDKAIAEAIGHIIVD